MQPHIWRPFPRSSPTPTGGTACTSPGRTPTTRASATPRPSPRARWTPSSSFTPLRSTWTSTWAPTTRRPSPTWSGSPCRSTTAGPGQGGVLRGHAPLPRAAGALAVLSGERVAVPGCLLLVFGWPRSRPLSSAAPLWGDSLGSALVCGRIAERLMRLCFLYCRQYAPYSKWFGTAFQQLPIPQELKDAIGGRLWPPRTPPSGRTTWCGPAAHRPAPQQPWRHRGCPRGDCALLRPGTSRSSTRTRLPTSCGGTCRALWPAPR